MNKFVERKNVINNLEINNQPLTKFASDKHLETLRLASMRSVSLVHSNGIEITEDMLS